MRRTILAALILSAVAAGQGADDWIDTALDSPQDIVPWETAPPHPGHTYRVNGRSVVVLLAGGKQTSE